MDRCAVFVDVGYLYAAGGLLCIDVKARGQIDLDISGVVGMLSRRAAAACSQPFLRTYWYDGAARGVPTQEHLRVGLVEDVKVRLGRINSQGQQKGVDALIYRDLMTVARERAITHAYLLAGDGDLVEGVRAAQDMGTHITLFHIAAAPGQGTSPDLLQEADRRIELAQNDLAPYFRRRIASPSSRAASPPGPDVPVPQPATPPDERRPDPAVTIAAGRAFATGWLSTALDWDVRALVSGHPRIPPHIDAELLHAVESAQGGLSLRGSQAERHAARGAFWDALRTAVAPANTPDPSGQPPATDAEAPPPPEPGQQRPLPAEQRV